MCDAAIMSSGRASSAFLCVRQAVKRAHGRADHTPKQAKSGLPSATLYATPLLALSEAACADIMANAATAPYIGAKISLISKSEIRYEGLLFSIDPAKSEIALQNGEATRRFIGRTRRAGELTGVFLFSISQ